MSRQFLVAVLIGALAFVILATANSGGYRYGVSDQAFYVPAVERELDSRLFPRDHELLDAQSKLIATEELTAAIVRTSGATLPHAAFALYVLTLLVLLWTSVLFARGLGLPWWSVTLLSVLLTFRHRIAKTGANSLEGYMHPRQLAFAVGVGALAALAHGRTLLAFGLVAVAGVLHPTTALFFGIVVVVAAYVSRPDWRRGLLLLGAASLVVGVWMLMAGPLAGRLTAMDPEWLGVFAEKDYLFPADWRLDTWLLNLTYPVVIAAIWRVRVRRGVTGPHERGVVYGLLALVPVFVVSVPLTMEHVALAVQLQVSRVFWVLDFAAMVSLAWWLTQSRKTAVLAVCVLLTASVARGYYLLEVANPERRLVRVTLPDTPWTETMRWIGEQPDDWHVLADPGHAWKYGLSVRVAAGRDTLLESVKDSAIAIYDREVAMRVKARTLATLDYSQLTTARALRLDADYDLDVIVVEVGHVLELPLLFKNAQFAVYDVR